MNSVFVKTVIHLFDLFTIWNTSLMNNTYQDMKLQVINWNTCLTYTSTFDSITESLR